MAEWQQFVSDFHLLRPWWLLALPLGLVLLWLGRKRMAMGDWARVIDPRWLPFMMESSGDSPRRLWPWILALMCAAIALSGPSWQQIPQPLHQQQSALVILLDLSPSMTSEDLKPNRITRARFKLRDILEQRNEGQTALIVYGGSAHVVTPLTDDSDTIISQLAVLSPDLMSTPGSNTEAALDLAITMLDNSGIQSADLLLVSDGVADAAAGYIGKQLRGSNLRLSVLGVGTSQGAPIPLVDGSFAKDSGGNIVMPKLDRTPLVQLAQRHNGQYSDLSADNSDLERLLAHIDAPLQSLNAQHKQLDRNFDSWHDQGYWLALVLLPLVVLAFRKGLIACLLMAPLLISQPSDAEEQQTTQPAGKTIASRLPDFLKTPNQRGQQAFQQQQFENAQQQFTAPQWRGSAAYRQGDYKAALQAFQEDNSATGLYNQGNALARLGELDKAIEAYDKALEKDPNLQDAAANKELLEQLKQQQQNQQGDDHQQGQDQSDSNSEQRDSESESSESENSDQQSQCDSQQNSQQNSQSDQQQDSKQENSDQPQGENQQPQDGNDSEDPQQAPKPGEQEQQSENEQQPSQGASQQNSDEEAEQAM